MVLYTRTIQKESQRIKKDDMAIQTTVVVPWLHMPTGMHSQRVKWQSEKIRNGSHVLLAIL